MSSSKTIPWSWSEADLHCGHAREEIVRTEGLASLALPIQGPIGKIRDRVSHIHRIVLVRLTMLDPGIVVFYQLHLFKLKNGLSSGPGCLPTGMIGSLLCSLSGNRPSTNTHKSHWRSHRSYCLLMLMVAQKVNCAKSVYQTLLC